MLKTKKNIEIGFLVGTILAYISLFFPILIGPIRIFLISLILPFIFICENKKIKGRKSILPLLGLSILIILFLIIVTYFLKPDLIEILPGFGFLLAFLCTTILYYLFYTYFKKKRKKRNEKAFVIIFCLLFYFYALPFTNHMVFSFYFFITYLVNSIISILIYLIYVFLNKEVRKDEKA